MTGRLPGGTDFVALLRSLGQDPFASAIAAANWDSMVFDLSPAKDSLQRVPMMEPLRGTADIVDSLFEGVSSPIELFERAGWLRPSGDG